MWFAVRVGLSFVAIALAGFWFITMPLDRTPIIESTNVRTVLRTIGAAARTAATKAEVGSLDVGWGVGDITPEPGTPTLGYGSRLAAPAVESTGPLRAVAFAMRVGDGTPIVLLSADLCFWPRELSRPLAARLANILPRDRLLFGATHTHDGPGAIVQSPIFEPMFGEFSARVSERVIAGAEQAVRTAIASLAPGGYRLHEIALPQFVMNRTGSHEPVSNLAVVIELEHASGGRAALVSYSAHATVISEDYVVSSADYPGAMTRALEFSGWELAGFMAAETAQAGPAIDGKLASQDGTELALTMGNRMAAALSRSMNEDRREFRSEGRLVSMRAPVALPAWAYRVPGLDRVVRPSLTTWLLGKRPPDAHVHAVGLDELMLIGHGFEQSAELGHRLRRWARERGQLVVPLSFNGEHHFYVVPEEAFDREGYEPTMAFFGPHLGSYLDAITRKVADSLKPR